MKKRILSLALLGTMLAGCATYSEVSSWKGVSIFFIRTITMAPPNGGDDLCQAVLVWGGFQSTLKGISKRQGSAASQSLAITASAMQATDSVTPGANFTYVATFDSGEPLTRTVKPFLSAEAGKFNPVSPINQEVMPAQPTFTWKKDDTSQNSSPSGFMLTVAPISGNIADKTQIPTNLTPVYAAFLDAASHSTGVSYGMPSDMKALTSEITTALSKLDPRLAKTDTNVKPLVAGTYIWMISPLKVDAEAINIAMGSQAFGIFKVQ